MPIENKVEKNDKKQIMIEAEMGRIVRDGLKAYGIEYDKIPEFRSRIREVIKNFLQFPQKNISPDQESQKEQKKL